MPLASVGFYGLANRRSSETNALSLSKGILRVEWANRAPTASRSRCPAPAVDAGLRGPAGDWRETQPFELVECVQQDVEAEHVRRPAASGQPLHILLRHRPGPVPLDLTRLL